MPEKKSRRFFILTASIGTGHSQAARAIAESIKEMHPEDSVRVLDFVSRDVLSVDQIIKRTYLQMIRLTRPLDEPRPSRILPTSSEKAF